MAMNRIQFQPGLSLPAFLQEYGTEEACEAALEQARWPEDFVCPRCGGRAHSCFWHRGVRMWQCRACHRQTSLHSGILLAYSKLPLTTWFLALYLLTQTKTNLAALELARHLGLCYRSAWRLKHKLMQAMTEREAWRDWCRSTMPTWVVSVMVANPDVVRRTSVRSSSRSRPTTRAILCIR